MKKFANTNSLWIMISTTVLLIFGTLVLLSALFGQLKNPTASPLEPLLTQVIAIVIGIAIFFIFKNIQTKYLLQYAIPILIVTFLFGLIVFIPALSIDEEVHRRILLFGFTFQPSELFKIGVIIATAAILNGISKAKKINYTHLIALALIIVAVVGMGALQPDNGTMLVILVSILSMIFITRIQKRYIFLAILIAILGVFISINTNSYAGERIETYWKALTNQLTAEELRDEGYQVFQAEKTIGAGELFGRGFGRGAQKFGYLPEATTDQIFSASLEEIGFIGGMFILILFSTFFGALFYAAIKTEDEFSKLLCMGLIMLLLTQVLLHISIPLGIAPNTGIPLPFFSKGGSIIIGSMIIIGIIVSISQSTVERKKYT